MEHSEKSGRYDGTFSKRVDGTTEHSEKSGRYDGTFSKRLDKWTVRRYILKKSGQFDGTFPLVHFQKVDSTMVHSQNI